MKKVDLERLLQSLAPVPRPRAWAEQYATPARIAAEVLYAAYGRGDIHGRAVLDAGSGSGIFAIGAALLGAKCVVGVEIDPEAVEIARENAARVGVNVEWRVADIRTVEGPFDTVIMNPPFGSQTRHADRPFLDKGMALGRVVYTFVNAKSEDFVVRRAERHGGRVTDRAVYAFPLPHAFDFHRDEVRRVPVVFLRFEVVGPSRRDSDDVAKG